MSTKTKTRGGWTSSLAILLAFALIATACAAEEGDGGESEDTTTSTAAQATTTTAASETTTTTTGDGGDEGEVYTLRFGDANPPSETSPMTIVAQYFIEELDARSNGQIQVEFFPNSELGVSGELLSGVTGGSIDFASITSGVVATADERYLVFSLPFLAPDHDALYRVFQSDLVQEMLQGVDGAEGLFFMDQGPFMPLTKDTPLPTPDAWNGLAMRVFQDPISVAMTEALGAQPVPLDFPEVYPSLQQGAIDGVIASSSAFIAGSLNEVATEVTMLPTTWVVQPVFVSDTTMESLPEELQQVVRDAAAAAAAHAEEMTRDIVAAGVTAMEDAGFNVLTDVSTDDYSEITDQIYAEFEGQIGADVVQGAQNAVARE